MTNRKTILTIIVCITSVLMILALISIIRDHYPKQTDTQEGQEADTSYLPIATEAETEENPFNHLTFKSDDKENLFNIIQKEEDLYNMSETTFYSIIDFIKNSDEYTTYTDRSGFQLVAYTLADGCYLIYSPNSRSVYLSPYQFEDQNDLKKDNRMILQNIDNISLNSYSWRNEIGSLNNYKIHDLENYSAYVLPGEMTFWNGEIYKNGNAIFSLEKIDPKGRILSCCDNGDGKAFLGYKGGPNIWLLTFSDDLTSCEVVTQDAYEKTETFISARSNWMGKIENLDAEMIWQTIVFRTSDNNSIVQVNIKNGDLEYKTYNLGGNVILTLDASGPLWLKESEVLDYTGYSDQFKVPQYTPEYVCNPDGEMRAYSQNSP